MGIVGGARSFVEARIGAVAVFFGHLNRFLFLGFGLGLGLRRLGAVGGFLGEANRAQILGPLADRDICGRNIGHRLDAFGILGDLSVQPDLFEFGGTFRFFIHRGASKFTARIIGRRPLALSYHALYAGRGPL